MILAFAASRLDHVHQEGRASLPTPIQSVEWIPPTRVIHNPVDIGASDQILGITSYPYNEF